MYCAALVTPFFSLKSESCFSLQQGDWFGNPWQSSVIIDAGSTGSRIHIYQYKASKPGLAIVQQPVSSLKVTPGLSTYAGQPENVGESLLPLLEYAYKQVPQCPVGCICRQLAQHTLHTPASYCKWTSHRVIPQVGTCRYRSTSTSLQRCTCLQLRGSGF